MAKLHRYCLSLADITVAMETDHVLLLDEKFDPFLCETAKPDFLASFRLVERLPDIPEAVLHEDDCYRVHPDGHGGYLRSFFDAPRDLTPYALASFVCEHHKIYIDYLEKGTHCVSELGSALFHLGLESLLLQENRLCLHASCIETRLGGILFSGRSGIGKSTQSDLWCRHRNATLLNGDRPILSTSGDIWLAWGSPYAGSSHCHLSRSCPISAIVMLRQDISCSLRPLTQPEAFRAIWSGLTMNSWNAKLVEQAVELTVKLIDTIPVYEFACTPDVRAVDFLEEELQKSWNQ